mgnify:CR=1 FL=1|jgi:hypothetical protein
MNTTPNDVLFDEANRQWDNGNMKQAFKLFQQAANCGDLNAQNSLGYFFDHGYGTKVDKAKAMYWYKRAARHGDSCAISNVAICYREMGKRALAQRWFEKAIRAGDGDARLELAKMHLSSKSQSSVQVEAARQQLKMAIEATSITPDSRNEARRLLKRLG